MREKLQGKREDVRGVLATVLALVGSAPLIAPFHKHLTEGTWGHFYHDPREHGGEWWLAYIAMQIVLLFAVSLLRMRTNPNRKHTWN